MGVLVTREHDRHNKRGIAYRGRARMNHYKRPVIKPGHAGT
jgi:hypothetical protein